MMVKSARAICYQPARDGFEANVVELLANVFRTNLCENGGNSFTSAFQIAIKLAKDGVDVIKTRFLQSYSNFI